MSWNRPYLIGLTGNIACGKSLVLRTLAELGAETIDADQIVHQLMRAGSPIARRIVERFGPEVLRPDGEIDRRRLGAIVFSDPVRLREVEAIVHPPTIAAIRERIGQSRSRVLAVDAIKLIESGFADECDQVWVVTCDPEQQLTRLMRRNGYSREEALRRIRAQPPQASKVARADRVIDNSGTEEETVALVRAAWAELPLVEQG
jgi:dephospho-CoA kinase